ncbi:SDR family NAD(P)-dependent oxidoreductase [Nocardia asteroides]|uniref:SDR family NAD(P)-dependent oxidoreductase n=1 Tax=Nocardia asteroides TaxID=1824 RepID=UPI001E3F59FC|nr:SDR family oxidoreductase [Nocardia asteroides]UGT63038.1 SDR family oxidoreductase [Nocardia asteroides]
MSPTRAGSGLGTAVARRFGRAGFRVALVARRPEPLAALADELAARAIEAVPFPADLADPAAVPELIAAVRARFGRIDVVEYGPIGGGQSFTPAAELDAGTLAALIPLLLLTPVEVVRAVLPEWRARGDGAFLLTHGYSAVEPLPGLSGVGPVMAAARNWLYALHGELAGAGVYAGTLAVAGYIAGSAIAESAAPPAEFVVDPDELAEHYGAMYTERDEVERFYPAEPGRHPGA